MSTVPSTVIERIEKTARSIRDYAQTAGTHRISALPDMGHAEISGLLFAAQEMGAADNDISALRKRVLDILSGEES